MNPRSVIHAENLSMRYRGNTSDSLSGVNIDIMQGEIFGIIGPNGAGKTTLISILCSVLTPTRGSFYYRLNGKILQGKQIKPILGYVPQELAFYEELTPLENFLFFGAMYNLKRPKIEENGAKLLRLLNLEHVKNKKTGSFSGGMKRRVNLAIGMLHRPSILFLDEPIVGVDVQSKRAIINLLLDENNRGVTIIYTSHHMKDAEELCSSLALLDNGRIIEQGKTKELLRRSGATSLEEFYIQKTGETTHN